MHKNKKKTKKNTKDKIITLSVPADLSDTICANADCIVNMSTWSSASMSRSGCVGTTRERAWYNPRRSENLLSVKKYKL